MPELSVIIPVYVDTYLRRCIDSVLNQSFQDFELLLIDDGSPNTSPAICDEYASKDSRVRVIHKPNGGLCSALNTGLDNVTGKWVAFIDNDDWISPEMYQSLMDGAKTADTDIVYCDFAFIFENVEQKYNTFSIGNTRVETLNNMLLDGYGGLRWHMIFRKSLLDIDNLRIPMLSVCEDTWYVFQLFLKARSICKVNGAFYHYNRVNEQATTLPGHFVPNYDEHYLWVWEQLKQVFVEAGYWNKLRYGVYWRVQLLKSNWILRPDRYKIYHKTWPEGDKYMLSNPFLHQKMKIAMWLLNHYIEIPVKFFVWYYKRKNKCLNSL